MAFTAGTGSLAFLDLVMMIFLQNYSEQYSRQNYFTSQADNQPVSWFGRRFTFHLYLTDSLNDGPCPGLDICEAVEQFNERFGFRNFVLKKRLKSEGKWDLPFIKNFLTTYGIIMTGESELNDQLTEPTTNNSSKNTVNVPKLKKVWVCGPPVMNEVFDRAFEQLLPDYNTGDDSGNPFLGKQM